MTEPLPPALADAADAPATPATAPEPERVERVERVERAGGWYVYLLECVDGSLYTGITNDVAARYAAHCAGKGARYTRAHPPRQLLGWQPFADRAAASRAEYRVKKMKPAAKRAFIKGAVALGD